MSCSWRRIQNERLCQTRLQSSPHLTIQGLGCLRRLTATTRTAFYVLFAHTTASLQISHPQITIKQLIQDLYTTTNQRITVDDLSTFKLTSKPHPFNMNNHHTQERLRTLGMQDMSDAEKTTQLLDLVDNLQRLLVEQEPALVHNQTIQDESPQDEQLIQTAEEYPVFDEV